MCAVTCAQGSFLIRALKSLAVSYEFILCEIGLQRLGDICQKVCMFPLYFILLTVS